MEKSKPLLALYGFLCLAIVPYFIVSCSSVSEDLIKGSTSFVDYIEPAYFKFVEKDLRSKAIRKGFVSEEEIKKYLESERIKEFLKTLKAPFIEFRRVLEKANKSKEGGSNGSK